ncbi:MAG: PPOX class F420-dependent oxidoreductase [Chloroflexi bacterium]|nr:MAG: PPOX class F420-dependent oxidoreductase [Chloroflexota bacterium]TMC41107.1 MAG: PPOX class F420-dependent oxidoreductase [Chloroflexota bacterium]TMD45192.1 MAG: PPOX class F420-dependent oxidoreductase [Chloroflexota bacterium]TMD77720.1 MAG: PPOX class F420-dependent oxidoreductase [Chloroflexota bacterium]
MKNMTPTEYRHFLLDRPRTGKLATVRSDGRPHVVPVWFDMDGETIVFTTWHQTVKAANMRRDPRVCMCVDDDTPPFDFVQIEGTAELINDAEARAHWARQIAGRYMGSDLAETYGKRNSVEGELIVRVTPTHILAQKAIAD